MGVTDSPSRAHGIGVAGLAVCWLAFAGAALLLYRPALSGPFLSDDGHYVEQNRYVHELSLDNVLVLLDPTGSVAIDVVNYAPAQLLVHALAWKAFGPATRGHHVLNVLLHALGATLLVALFLASGAPRMGALVAGALFLLHPANVEAVAWISQLKSVLALPLVVAALLALPRRPALATACFALALLAKPAAVVALPVAALLERARGATDPRWRWLAGWTLLFAVFAVVEFATHQRGGAAGAILDEGALAALRTMATLGSRYVAMAATGLGVSSFHELDASGPLDLWWLAAWPLAIAVGWRFAVVFRRRSPEAAYWMWAAVGFAPVSQIFPFLYPLADRYLYFILPGLLGAVLLAGSDLLAGLSEPRRRVVGRAAMVLGVALAVSFAARVPSRAAVWRSNAALLADAARHYPDGKVANVLAAKRAAGRGDAVAAVAALRRAADRGYNRFQQLETDPSYASLRDAPAFRALVRELAAGWIASGSAKTDPTPSELRMLAHAHVTVGEAERALVLLERAIAAGGPYEPEIRADAEAIRAALEAGAPDRVRLGISGAP